MSLSFEQASVMTDTLGELHDLYSRAVGVVANAGGTGQNALDSAGRAITLLDGDLRDKVIAGVKSFATWADLAKAAHDELEELVGDVGDWWLANKLDEVKAEAGAAYDAAKGAANWVQTALIALAVIAGAIAVVYVAREVRSFA